MIRRLVLFGATGDLAGRFLLPAVAALHAAGRLPDGFELVGAARQNWGAETFRRHAYERLDEHGGAVPAAAREGVLRALSYRQVDIGDPESVARVVHAEAPSQRSGEPLAAYLALPPGLFAAAVVALGAAELPAGSRLALEKPFGEDLHSAQALNRLLADVSGAAGEDAVFRVDHVLGMATVQNLLGMRLANRVLDPLWNGTNIERVDILWEETLALEGRAGYYDHSGALKDVLQNHMLQVLSLIAMEPPVSLGERDLRDRKVEVLRSVRAAPPGDLASRTRRARYIAGRIAGRTIPAYAEEEGVDPDRCTETFAEVVLELDSPRWEGCRFVLRAGKALGRRRKLAIMRFRPLPGAALGTRLAANELRIGLDGPHGVELRLTGAEAGPPPHPVPVTLTARPPGAELPAYARVLLDILEGGSGLSIRGDEAEEAWRVVTPVLNAWAEGLVPLDEYPAGSVAPLSAIRSA